MTRAVGWATAVLTAWMLLSCGVSVASSPLVEKARTLVDKRQDTEAETLLLEAIEEGAREHEAYFLLAKIHLRRQDHKTAVKFAERAIKIDDSISEYHLWLARSYLAKAMESGMVSAFRYARRGKGEYEKAIELDSTNTEARFELCMYLVAAPGMVGGDKDKGVEQATIIEKQDSLFGAYAWAGIWEQDDEFEKAEASLRSAVVLDTSSSHYAMYALGFFFERRERYDEAEGVFKEILEIEPDDMGALFQVGRIYVLAERNLDEAETCFKRYLEVEPRPNSPDWAAAHWRLGMVYDLQGMTDPALTELRKAVEMAPDNKEYQKTLKNVEKKQEG
ncbi:MAG: tetratricopeptide repeat protein [Candidatus Eisenbacteria bacterium]